MKRGKTLFEFDCRPRVAPVANLAMHLAPIDPVADDGGGKDFGGGHRLSLHPVNRLHRGCGSWRGKRQGKDSKTGHQP